MSGLAKAFFYAGSRALLVSHWPVVSDAAVAITTRMLSEAAKPGVGRAEAHRRAMMAMIDDKDRPHYAHPLFWAPFVVVGEGGVIKLIVRIFGYSVCLLKLLAVGISTDHGGLYNIFLAQQFS